MYDNSSTNLVSPLLRFKTCPFYGHVISDSSRKLANSACEAARGPRHALVDLTVLAFESARAYWQRRLQWQSVSGASDTGYADLDAGIRGSRSGEELVDHPRCLRIHADIEQPGDEQCEVHACGDDRYYLASFWAWGGRGRECGDGDHAATGLGIAPEPLARLFEPFTHDRDAECLLFHSQMLHKPLLNSDSTPELFYSRNTPSHRVCKMFLFRSNSGRSSSARSSIPERVPSECLLVKLTHFHIYCAPIQCKTLYPESIWATTRLAIFHLHRKHRTGITFWPVSNHLRGDYGPNKFGQWIDAAVDNNVRTNDYTLPHAARVELIHHSTKPPPTIYDTPHTNATQPPRSTRPRLASAGRQP
ncbi:hypothetical protein DFH09DRAFT_1166812 [Mycena vulgaris]|nr:hypothetical protein DFH09DRAFT_1166812 [Mycena vulgaris]